MATTVKLFAYAGLVNHAISPSGPYATSAISNVKEPYLARQSLTVSDTAQSTGSLLTTNRGTAILLVQVEAGKKVTIECNPPHRTVVADGDSPQYSGSTVMTIGPDWTFSIKELATT